MKKICRFSGIGPKKYEFNGKNWVVIYVSGKSRRIKVKTLKTEKGAYKFYNSLPLDY